MNRKILFLLLILPALSGLAQSSYVAGVFPAIDHSGTISNKLDDGLYYFSAVPLVHLQKAGLSRNAYFNLLYFEQSLSYTLTNNFSATGSYVYQRVNLVYDNCQVTEAMRKWRLAGVTGLNKAPVEAKTMGRSTWQTTQYRE